MGKKSKQKKLRRDHHYQATPVRTIQARPVESMLNPVEPAAGTPRPSLASSEEHIRRDILRILTILGIVIVLLVAFVVVNKKTTYIQRAGSKFSRFLRL